MYLQWRVSRPRPNLVPNPVVYFQSVLTVVLKALICSLGITSVDMLARIVALLTEELLLGSVSLSWLTVCFRSRPVSTELSAPPLLSAVNLQQSPFYLEVRAMSARKWRAGHLCQRVISTICGDVAYTLALARI